MSKVIKNNDGVAVVEGTPAASLVKDVDRIFTTKPPKRMAGENIAQPRKIPKMEEKLVFKDIPIARAPATEEQESKPQDMPAASSPNTQEKTAEEKEMKREEAVEKTKEFKRQRSTERSAEEEEATQGKFITALGR